MRGSFQLPRVWGYLHKKLAQLAVVCYFFPVGKMAYSYKEMEALCLDLAKDAEPLEAGALREIAKNYADAAATEKPPRGFAARHILLIAAVIYAIWTPVYFLWPAYEPAPRPKGVRVEQIMGFVKTPDGRYTTRSYKFGSQEVFVTGSRQWVYPDDPLAVYEDDRPLPKQNYQFSSPNHTWRFVTIRTSDGTDPTKNGRRYYAVEVEPLCAE